MTYYIVRIGSGPNACYLDADDGYAEHPRDAAPFFLREEAERHASYFNDEGAPPGGFVEEYTPPTRPRITVTR